MTKRKATKKHVVHRAKASKAVRKPRKAARRVGRVPTPSGTIYVSYSTTPPRKKPRSR